MRDRHSYVFDPEVRPLLYIRVHSVPIKYRLFFDCTMSGFLFPLKCLPEIYLNSIGVMVIWPDAY